MTTQDLDFTFRVPTWKLLLLTFGALGFGAGMAVMAYGNEAGLRLFRFITLPPQAATMVFWALAAVCVAGAGMGVVMLATGASRRTHRIRLTDTEFTAPGSGLKRPPVTVPLSQVHSVAVQTVNRVHFLVLKTSSGKIVVNRSDIGKERFEQLREALAARIQALAARAAE